MEHRSIKSAERTIGLFELFSAEQRPLRVGEVADLLGMPQPSVTMLVRNLLALGYLEYDQECRTYIPTVRIALLGSWIHQRYTQDRQLELRLEVLFNAVDETTFIGVQNGIHVQYILYMQPKKENRFDVQAEQLRPIAVTAVGKILLSLKPDAEVRSILHRANAEVLDPRFRVDIRAFMEKLDDIRRLGYAETAGEVRHGIGTVAMAVPPLVGRSPMAVAVGCRLEHLPAKKEQILTELRTFTSVFTAAA